MHHAVVFVLASVGLVLFGGAPALAGKTHTFDFATSPGFIGYIADEGSLFFEFDRIDFDDELALALYVVENAAEETDFVWSFELSDISVVPVPGFGVHPAEQSSIGLGFSFTAELGSFFPGSVVTDAEVTAVVEGVSGEFEAAFVNSAGYSVFTSDDPLLLAEAGIGEETSSHLYLATVKGSLSMTGMPSPASCLLFLVAVLCIAGMRRP